MKPIQRLYLSGDQVHFSDMQLVLELNSCGRGFITAKTDTDYTGKLVRVDVGYMDKVVRWFTGYVERSQPVENGFQRLFVRELIGVFDKAWPCSMQHPTLRQLAAWLTDNSGINIQVPDADYSDKPVPHFTHSGTGFQLLNVIGQAFTVPDCIWYQLPDGDLYVGGADKSLFAGRPVDIPAEFSRAGAAGNSMTVPMIQTMRPGVEMNGQRVTKVALNNGEMVITWTPRNRETGQPLQKTPLQRQIESHYPELASGLHTPKMARVVAHTEAVASGNLSDPFRPRYAVDLQLLDADGNPDGETPVYPAVPLPVPMAGHDAGMFQFPPVGTKVEVGFTGGRPDKPFVRQTMADGNSLPEVKPGEQLQQQREEVSQRVTQAGDWVRKTDQSINESSQFRNVTADTETRELVSRETTIKATDKTRVLGTASLLAGAIQQVSAGDFGQAVKGNVIVTVGGNSVSDVVGQAEITVGQSLIEKVGKLRSSVAEARQEVIAPVVWVGSQNVNVLQLMLETLDVVKQLAEFTASHTHNNTGAPLNATSLTGVGAGAIALKAKYYPIIG